MNIHRPRVLYLQYANPGAYPPIVHGAHILAEAGADVWVLGTRSRIAAAIEFPHHPRIRLTLVREGTGTRQKIAFARFFLASLWAARRFRPDWLYVSDAFAAPAGLAVAAITRVRVLYHEHDVHTESSPSAFVRLCMAARKRLALTALRVIVPSAGRADHLSATLGVRQVDVVLNCPRRSEILAQRDAGDGPLRLVYQGTIVPQRLPLALADAIAELAGTVTLTLAGYEPAGAEGHTMALIERAARGAPGAILYAGLLTARKQLLEFCARFDVGLALVPIGSGDVNMRSMAGASNKAFDYLACGLPLLVSDLEDWRQMFVHEGYAKAVVPDDITSLVTTFRWLARHRRELRAMGAAGQDRVADEWNYEHQFAPVRERLLAAVPNRHASSVSSAA
jgi:glycosyltransferase involved in cell wall biosynthesis